MESNACSRSDCSGNTSGESRILRVDDHGYKLGLAHCNDMGSREESCS